VGANAVAPSPTEHKKRPPVGKIPVITSADGFTLYESRAICKYLRNEVLLSTSTPDSDIEAAALFDQAQCAECSTSQSLQVESQFEKFAKRFMGLPPDDAVVSDALRSVEMFFDVAERLLHHKDYMAEMTSRS